LSALVLLLLLLLLRMCWRLMERRMKIHEIVASGAQLAVALDITDSVRPSPPIGRES